MGQKWVTRKVVCAGQAPEAWAIGGRCQAYSSLDGSWYTATVTGVSAAGHFVVQLDQGGPEEEVPQPPPPPFASLTLSACFSCALMVRYLEAPAVCCMEAGTGSFIDVGAILRGARVVYPYASQLKGYVKF